MSQTIPPEPPDRENETGIPTPRPPSSMIERNPLSIFPAARRVMRDPENDTIDVDQEFYATRAKVLGAIGADSESSQHDVLVQRLINLYERFPKESELGFTDVMEFGLFAKRMNSVMAYLHSLAVSDPEHYRLRDTENPDKFRGHFLVQCADGRCSPVPFKEPSRVLNIFDTEWLPAAGTILFPEVPVPATEEAVDEYFRLNPDVKEKMFARLEFLYGTKLQEELADYRKGTLSTIWFEYQSHFDGEHFPGHGCGAHKSNLDAAQMETIKDCFVTRAWLKEKYAEEYEKGAFKIFRTAHDTGEGKPVYSAERVDNERLTEDAKARYGSVIDYAHENFKPAHLEQKGAGIVRSYRGNPTGIEMAEHDEQTIRISNLHFASTLMGQSVLEICWTDDPQILYGHVKVLLSIIEKNFRNPAHWDRRNEEAAEKAKRLHQKRPPLIRIPPAIVHFDLVKGNREMEMVYDKLLALLKADPEVAERLEEGSLQFIATTTDRDTYKLRLKV